MEQATTLASWYEGEGEQSSHDWLIDARVPTAYVDNKRQKEVSYEQETVTIFIK